MSSATTGKPTATPPGIEPAVAPPPGSPRFPLVDSLRAIAALSVLLYHGAYLSGAAESAWYGPAVGRLEIGVAIFFVISGFLLYRPFAAVNLENRPQMRTRDYLRRRFLRIVPAYWLALTVLAIAPGLDGVFTEDWWIYYGFGQIYSQDTFTQGIPQAWTLCVEVTFYLLLPVYALALGRLTAGRSRAAAVRVELIVLAVLSAAVLVLRTVLIAEGGGSLIPYTLLGLFDWFAPGMALAVISIELAHRQEKPRIVAVVEQRPWLPWLGALAAFGVLALTVTPPSLRGTFFNGREYFELNVLSAVVGALMLVPAVIGASAGGWVRRVLGLPVLAWLGLISYGIYLWHAELMLWLSGKGAREWIPGAAFVVLTLVAAAWAISIAAASYYGFERPLLRFKDGFRRRRAD